MILIVGLPKAYRYFRLPSVLQSFKKQHDSSEDQTDRISTNAKYVFQKDSLSLLLYVLSIIPLSLALRRIKTG